MDKNKIYPEPNFFSDWPDGGFVALADEYQWVYVSGSRRARRLQQECVRSSTNISWYHVYLLRYTSCQLNCV